MRIRRVRLSGEMFRKIIYGSTAFVIGFYLGFTQSGDQAFPVEEGNKMHYDAIKMLSEAVETKIELNSPDDETELKYLQDRIDIDLNGNEKPGINLAEALKEDLKITPDKMPVGTELPDAGDQKAFDQSIFGIATAIVTNPAIQFGGGGGLFVFLCGHGYL